MCKFIHLDGPWRISCTYNLPPPFQRSRCRLQTCARKSHHCRGCSVQVRAFLASVILGNSLPLLSRHFSSSSAFCKFFTISRTRVQLRYTFPRKPRGALLIDFRSESSPLAPPMPRQPQQPPPAELVGCATQSRDEVKAWVRSNAGVLLRSGGGFDKAVYQEMLAALLPLTLSPLLNTVLVLPDSDKEIMRGMFELFEELAKAGGSLRT